MMEKEQAELREQYYRERKAMREKKQKSRDIPDFKSSQERDDYFRDNADYFTAVRKSGLGYERNEAPTLAAAVNLAKTKITIGGGRYMIYAVIGEQSAFVQTVQ